MAMRLYKYCLASAAILLISISGLKAQTVSFTPTNVTCYGADDATMQIDITGGTSTYWYVCYYVSNPSESDSIGPTTQSSYTFTDLLPNTLYLFYVRDNVSGDFVGAQTNIFSQPDVLNATVSSTNVYCSGANTGTITISNPTGGHGQYEYSINGGSSWQSSGSFTNLPADHYNVQIRDYDYPGCIAILDNDLEITEPAPLNAVVTSTNLTCYNNNSGTITISSPSGGSGNYQYTIDGGSNWQSSGSFTNLNATTTYSVRMRDANYPSCVQILNDNLVLDQPDPLYGDSILVIKPLTCYEGSDAILRADPEGGTPPYTYLWFYDAPGSPTSYVNTGVTTRDYTTASRGGYRVRINDANNCGPVNTVVLSFIEYVNPNVPLPLTVSATSTPACDGQNNGTITITGTGGWTPYNYLVVNSSSDTTGPQSFNPIGSLYADTYEPYIIDDKGCTKKGTDVIVSSIPAPTANAGTNASTCFNTAYTISGASATNYSSLLWTVVSGAGTLANAATLTPTYTPATGDAGSTVVLRLTANGNSPCASVSDDMNLQVVAAPTANAGTDASTCVNVAYTISGASATNYSSLLWTVVSGAGTLADAATLTPTYTPDPADAGTTVVLRLTANGNAPCASTSDDMNLQVVAAPTANAGTDASTCVNVAYTISGASA
ncbi:MAG: hypothetical protein JW973_03345, partial [Bacteroidales bacterium]|nr:hypothetical protein [Bacteroidales bacterium]